MGLPKRFDKKLQRHMGLHAVWPPGNPIELADVLQRQDGIFRPVDNLSSFQVKFRRQRFKDQRAISLKASGVSVTVIQGGGEVDVNDVDVAASATLEISFTKENSYFIRTPALWGVEIEDLRKVGRSLRKHPEWQHRRFYLAWQIYSARDFMFLGSESRNRKVSFGGNGSAILKLLSLGATANITRSSTSNVSVAVVGKGGPMAMAIARVRRNGDIEFV